jgi:hypothetical protein
MLSSAQGESLDTSYVASRQHGRFQNLTSTVSVVISMISARLPKVFSLAQRNTCKRSCIITPFCVM